MEYFYQRRKFSKRSIRPINGTLTGATILGQSRPGSNNTERVLHTFLNFRTGDSSLDAIL